MYVGADDDAWEGRQMQVQDDDAASVASVQSVLQDLTVRDTSAPPRVTAVMNPTGGPTETHACQTAHPLVRLGKAAHKAMLRSEGITGEAQATVLCVAALTNPLRDNKNKSGDRRLAAIHRGLDSCGWARSNMQRLLHWWYLQACLPIVYGDEWELVSTRVLREHGLKRVQPYVFALAARRTGKSVAVSMFVKNLLMHVHGIKIAIFSTGMRASTSLKDIILSFIYSDSPEVKSRLVQVNKDTIKMAREPIRTNDMYARQVAQNANTTSTLKVYPDNPKGTVSSCVVVLQRERVRRPDAHRPPRSLPLPFQLPGLTQAHSPAGGPDAASSPPN